LARKQREFLSNKYSAAVIFTVSSSIYEVRYIANENSEDAINIATSKKEFYKLLKEVNKSEKFSKWLRKFALNNT
jgi:hypothetical protein